MGFPTRRAVERLLTLYADEALVRRVLGNTRIRKRDRGLPLWESVLRDALGLGHPISRRIGAKRKGMRQPGAGAGACTKH